MDIFLETCKLLRLIHEKKIENLNRLIATKEIESQIRNLPANSHL